MAEFSLSPTQLSHLRQRLLRWFEQNQRDLPWRHSRNPYAIWVSEIMLQQTRVATVIDRFTEFLQRFPDIAALAKSTEADVLALWSGLGYYRRARMLHKAAQVVLQEHHGEMPTTAAALRKLPGIGDYTAAAIASIAHDEAVAVVDGNVERVLCRLMSWSIEKDRDAAFRKQISHAAQTLLSAHQAGQFNQAMMELGAMICTPRSPQCAACPIRAYCLTQGEHKTAPRAKMIRQDIGCALLVRQSGKGTKQHPEVLLELRSSQETVMPNMWELPALQTIEMPESALLMTVSHAIMQVNYRVHVRSVEAEMVPEIAAARGERRWIPLAAAGELPLTGLARKILTRAHLLPKAATARLHPGRAIP